MSTLDAAIFYRHESPIRFRVDEDAPSARSLFLAVFMCHPSMQSATKNEDKCLAE
jgi:hypothetical protein